MEKFLKLAELYVTATQCTPILKEDIAYCLYDITEISKKSNDVKSSSNQTRNSKTFQFSESATVLPPNHDIPQKIDGLNSEGSSQEGITNSILDNSPISDGRNTICSLSNDTWVDSIIKVPKTAQIIEKKSYTAKNSSYGIRSHTPIIKDDPNLNVCKEDEKSSNYFQKAVGTRVIKNRSNYSRCYKNRSLSSNKNEDVISITNNQSNKDSVNSKQVILIKRNPNDLKKSSKIVGKQTSSFVQRDQKYISCATKRREPVLVNQDEQIRSTKIESNNEVLDAKINSEKDFSKNQIIIKQTKKLKSNPSNYMTKSRIGLAKSLDCDSSPTKRYKKL